jgi:hypothetical protein
MSYKIRFIITYPDGSHIKDLKDVRELLYKMQRPGITPLVSELGIID